MIVAKIGQFIDETHKVQEAADRAHRRALIRGGAYTRRVARSGLRKRKRISNPNEPPSIHSPSQESLKRILFAYDAQAKAVVVGVQPFPSKNTDAPAVLEHGGMGKFRKKRGAKLVRVRVQPRPYLKPALEKSGPKITEFYRDAIR